MGWKVEFVRKCDEEVARRRGRAGHDRVEDVRRDEVDVAGAHQHVGALVLAECGIVEAGTDR